MARDLPSGHCLRRDEHIIIPRRRRAIRAGGRVAVPRYLAGSASRAFTTRPGGFGTKQALLMGLSSRCCLPSQPSLAGVSPSIAVTTFPNLPITSNAVTVLIDSCRAGVSGWAEVQDDVGHTTAIRYSASSPSPAQLNEPEPHVDDISGASKSIAACCGNRSIWRSGTFAPVQRRPGPSARPPRRSGRSTSG